MRIDFMDKFKQITDQSAMGDERNRMVFDRVNDFEGTLKSIDELIKIREN